MNFPVIGDLYNRIFTNQSSHPFLYVDYTVWNPILANLPEDYRLADEELLRYEELQ